MDLDLFRDASPEAVLGSQGQYNASRGEGELRSEITFLVDKEEATIYIEGFRMACPSRERNQAALDGGVGQGGINTYSWPLDKGKCLYEPVEDEKGENGGNSIAEHGRNVLKDLLDWF